MKKIKDFKSFQEKIFHENFGKIKNISNFIFFLILKNKMDNRLLSQLRKNELERLPLINPGTVAQMRQQLRNRLVQFHIDFRGVKLNDYMQAVIPPLPRTNKKPKRYDETPEYKQRAQKKADDELFNEILPTMKPRKNDTDIIKQNIIEERHLFDNMGSLYNSQQTELRNEYEQRVKDVKNKKNFQKYIAYYASYIFENSFCYGHL